MRNETRRSWDGSRVREALFPYLSHHVAPHGSRLRRVCDEMSETTTEGWR